MVSLGCPKNLVDSEVMLGLAQHSGHELTGAAADADVLVVNTCAFIDKAKQESIDAILEMAEHKKNGACRRLIVTGCLAERYRDELREQIPEIDAVLGTGEVEDIVAALGDGDARPEIGASGRGSRDAQTRLIPLLRASGEAIAVERLPESRIPGPESRVPDPEIRVPGVRPTYIYDANTPRLLATPRHYAYIKIAEGCDYKCAFCIIPTLRGAYRSRPIASIVDEARSLVSRGVKEVLLISQDTSFYGIDRGERGALAELLRQLARVDGLAWVRMLYLYPTTIGDDVLGVMAQHPQICKYVDLPLQHAADSVLKRMKRPGTGDSYLRLIERIRRKVPGVSLRTTFIVGFPGETNEEFAELERFVEAAAFDHVGVFTYSHEEGTSAHELADDVPVAVKRRRQSRLMSLQKRLVTRAQKTRVGSRVQLLVDGPSSEHELVLRARTAGQAPDIDPLVYLTECDPSLVSPGDLIEAEIVGSSAYDLLARPLFVTEPA